MTSSSCMARRYMVKGRHIAMLEHDWTIAKPITVHSKLGSVMGELSKVSSEKL